MVKGMRTVSKKIPVFENLEQVIRQEISLANQEEPFFVVNVGAILNQHKNWLMKLPRIKPYYAVKCNPEKIMLEVLSALGLGFDCASKGEIDKVMSMGIAPERIIYANPTKTKSYIRHAKSCGVDLFTFDGEFELRKMAELYPESRLVLRIKVDDSQSLCKFSSKFGASIEDSFGLLKTAKMLNLNVVGVSFHVGSGCQAAYLFEKAIEDAKIVFDYALKMGFKMYLLDIGGGFPGVANPTVSFDEIAETINLAIERDFPVNYVENLEIIAEPGRYYAASVFTCVTQIIAKKTFIYDDEEVQKNAEIIRSEGLLKFKPNLVENEVQENEMIDIDMKNGVKYYMNDGVYGSFNNVLTDHVVVTPRPYFLDNDENAMKTSKLSYVNTTLFGPTCDSLDMVRDQIYLPDSLAIGDYIVFHEMGAYTVAISSDFNGFKPARKVFFVDRHTLTVLKGLLAWPRIKNLIIKNEKEQEKVDGLFEGQAKVRPTCGQMKQLKLGMISVH